MKTLTVRVPEELASELEAESRERKVTRSELVRERLGRAPSASRGRTNRLHAIADLVGSVDGLPTDLSGRRKAYLRSTGYGRKRSR